MNTRAVLAVVLALVADANAVICTLDVKVCASGITLARDPSNDCKFPVCTDLPPRPQVFCPADTMRCPDGSYVSRDPELACAHRPCPVAVDARTCSQDVRQCPGGTYVSRNPALGCQFNPCPPHLEPQEVQVQQP